MWVFSPGTSYFSHPWRRSFKKPSQVAIPPRSESSEYWWYNYETTCEVVWSFKHRYEIDLQWRESETSFRLINLQIKTMLVLTTSRKAFHSDQSSSDDFSIRHIVHYCFHKKEHQPHCLNRDESATVSKSFQLKMLLLYLLVFFHDLIKFSLFQLYLSLVSVSMLNCASCLLTAASFPLRGLLFQHWPISW